MTRLFKTSIALAACVMLTACGVNPSKATKAMEAQGLKNVQIEGYAWFGGCGKDDTFASYFSATGVNGAEITGTVCQGLFKGTTIRYD